IGLMEEFGHLLQITARAEQFQAASNVQNSEVLAPFQAVQCLMESRHEPAAERVHRLMGEGQDGCAVVNLEIEHTGLCALGFQAFADHELLDLPAGCPRQFRPYQQLLRELVPADPAIEQELSEVLEP